MYLRQTGPLVVVLGEDGADQVDDGVPVVKDADDVGPALDLLVEPLQGIGRVDLGSMVLGEEASMSGSAWCMSWASFSNLGLRLSAT